MMKEQNCVMQIQTLHTKKQIIFMKLLQIMNYIDNYQKERMTK